MAEPCRLYDSEIRAYCKDIDLLAYTTNFIKRLEGTAIDFSFRDGRSTEYGRSTTLPYIFLLGTYLVGYH
jgi:hypothetical protein|uniref:Uncharacterized protein n=1 Tax=Picea glauca TaxID=3330 RepID=A0A124GMG4_PICGL|nr:hypothetical protein ABT39_MTgene2442 [Picea glauca]QHR86802.1 hypothetical protein Q903MT_gene807 [Picea sitchensis]